MLNKFARSIALVAVCLLISSAALAATTIIQPTPPIPVQLAVNPVFGPTAGGTAVTLTGTGFLAASKVTFGSVPATNVVVVSSTQITCTTPPHASGSVAVIVSSASAGAATALAKTGFFTYSDPPVITSVVPARGTFGTQLVITGNNFLLPPGILAPATSTNTTGSVTTLPIAGAPAVKFGAALATLGAPITNTTLTCYAPQNALGTVDVTVTNGFGQSGTASGAFTYVPGPTVTSVKPPSGPVSGGTNVTVTGSGFTGTTVGVTFGGEAATNVAVTNDTTLTCTTPALLYAVPLNGGAAGTSVIPVGPNPPIITPIANMPVQVAVIVDGARGVLADGFTYVPAPSISAVIPVKGTTAGGTQAQVLGTGLAAGAGITFGGTGATNVTAISGGLSCVTPAHDPGLVDVVVTNPDGTTITKTGAFTYFVPPVAPVITSPLTANATEGQPFTYTLTATGSTPITFSAAPLPSGLAFGSSSATISGSPKVSGQVNIGLTAKNSTGVAAATLVLTIAGTGQDSPPVFVSPPTAKPNPATVGQPVAFAALATDPDGDLLTYAWDFGDGTTAVFPAGATVATNGGPYPTHVYNAAGNYTVTVTVSDGPNSISRTIAVTVNPVQFTITAAGIGFNFASKNTPGDTLSISGVLPLPAGFKPAGQSVTVAVGAYTVTLILNTPARASALTQAVFNLLTNQRFTFTTSHAALFTALAPLGFVNDNVPPPGVTVDVPVTITLGGETVSLTMAMTYTAQKGRQGSAVYKAPTMAAKKKK